MMSKFTEIITDRYKVAGVELDRAQQFRSQYGGQLETVLVNLGILSDEQVSAALAESLGIEFLPEDAIEPLVERYAVSPQRQVNFLTERKWFRLNSSEEDPAEGTFVGTDGQGSLLLKRDGLTSIHHLIDEMTP